MADLLQIVDLADSDQVQLSLISDSNQPESAPPASFPFPLSDTEMAEMRWYFNEYPNDTFGDAKTRADTVETGLKALGQLLFQAAFGSNDESKLLLNKAVDSEPPRLAIVSSRPEFLSIPWELMNGGEDTYLASRFSGISRRLSSGPIESFTAELPIDQLNVLLLLPPTGEGSGSVATEALSALESLAVSAELDCLRPSTATSLREQLTRQP